MKHIVEATAGKAAVRIHQAEKVIALLDQGNTFHLSRGTEKKKRVRWTKCKLSR